MPVLQPPSGLVYTLNTVGSVILRWFPISGAVSYNLYKRTDSLAPYGPPINPSPITTTTFTDISPNTSIINYYTITTVNGSGESLPSQVLIVDLTTKSGLPRVDPDINAFNTFIGQRGYKVLWQRAQVCSCSLAGRSTTDASDLDHPLCKNKQWIWTTQGVIIVALTRMGKQTNLGADGIWDIGTFLISTQSGNKVGFYDRLTIQDTSVPYSECILKGASNGVDNTKFPAITSDLPIVDFFGNLYAFGVDYGFDSSGNVKWGGFSGKQPSTGTPYSVQYETQPRILVVEYPHSVRGQITQTGGTTLTYKDFPLQTIGKLEFFIN
jgi:hypothetical protein